MPERSQKKIITVTHHYIKIILNQNKRIMQGHWPVSYTHLDVYKRQNNIPLILLCKSVMKLSFASRKEHPFDMCDVITVPVSN